LLDLHTAFRWNESVAGKLARLAMAPELESVGEERLYHDANLVIRSARARFGKALRKKVGLPE
jgi:hypothetical protein